MMSHRLRRIVALCLLSFLAAEPLAFAVDGKRAAYTGGSAAAFTGAKDPIEGELNTSDQTSIIFTSGDKHFQGTSLTIPYASIIDLEYGQKAGRRVGAAVATTILLGPLGLLTLFSHKKNHYLTIGYKDADDKDQVAILELGKDIVRATLAVAAMKSGKKITYQDDDARKSSGGN